MNDGTDTLRIGTLGGAAITPMALLRPAREVGGVEVAAVAARDPARAEAFARKHGIERVHDSYEALLSDPTLEAVYIPLPNSHHCAWTLRALALGKHVLCEKPLAANAVEAERMAKAARESTGVLAEAFHWRYHALADRMRAIIAAGELGQVQRIEVDFCVPMLRRGDIRYRLDLAGGACMDLGCYTVNVLRVLAGAEPEVVSARALLSSPGVDRAMRAELRFADGRTGSIRCSLLSRVLFRMRVRVIGERAELRVLNPIAPQFFHRLVVRGPAGKRRERVPGEGSYTAQLRAFRAWVRDGVPMPSDAEDGVRNMRVIDDVYRAAGLEPRTGV